MGKTPAVSQPIPAEWTELPEPWHIAFALAWEALLAGSPPVGAVVVDADGGIIGRGRSRRHESVAPIGELAGSRLAHAEINALAALPVESGHDLWLYTTLEPCYLCTAAAAVTHMNGVSFAGGDPMWRFLERIEDFDPELARRRFERRGPMRGPLGVWAALLPLVERLERNPSGTRIEAFTAVGDGLVDYALDLAASGHFQRLTTMPLETAIASLWPDLVGLSDGAG
jgi:tRNA(adenine34) deaminase